MAFLPDVINDLVMEDFSPRRRGVPSLMRTDISETDSDYLLEIELPGFSKKEIHIQLKDGYLTVSAKKEERDEDGSKKYVRRERRAESCSRTFYVGKGLSSGDVKAKFSDGILTLRVPKEVETPKEEYVEIGE